MNEVMLSLIGSSQEVLRAGFVVFLRVGAAMAMIPAFGEQSVPQRVRLGLALAFTAIVAPAVFEKTIMLGENRELVSLLFLTEAMIGLAIGLALRLFVFALQIAGSMAAQATSLSQIFGGGAGVEPLPAIGHVMVISGLALAVLTGLHVNLAKTFILSYDVLRPGEFPDATVLADWGISKIASAFALAFALASPFLIASLIYNVAMGVINRAMPQLMVAFVGAPAITAGGLILMFLIMPMLLGVWSEGLQAFLHAPFELPR